VRGEAGADGGGGGQGVQRLSGWGLGVTFGVGVEVRWAGFYDGVDGALEVVVVAKGELLGKGPVGAKRGGDFGRDFADAGLGLGEVKEVAAVVVVEVHAVVIHIADCVAGLVARHFHSDQAGFVTVVFEDVVGECGVVDAVTGLLSEKLVGVYDIEEGITIEAEVGEVIGKPLRRHLRVVEQLVECHRAQRCAR